VLFLLNLAVFAFTTVADREPIGSESSDANAGIQTKGHLSQATTDFKEQDIVVNGHKMHLVCMGKGTPTVVFEAGLADSADVWSEVQRKIANRTRACAYDRAGSGKSEAAGSAQRDPRNASDDLHQLLHRSDAAPPYVLVGHSYGGLLVRLYASA